ncbi:ATP-binding protein [Sphingomonas sp. BN140010]|uniref:histidine kinase n=1 Tax=Sphingomonas arvum TaxID=2992113 RepID=A0ABT3JE60_9SPHN|nr:ATP-binding protein [Sphingomonas sp. BN140010]MCW3797361.1 ATP-binding protein [Sphingomonas sp. BN140010]
MEARKALTESEARLRAVIDAAPVGLVFADASGQITGGNNRVEEILGHPVLPSKDVASYNEWIGFHEDGRRVEGHEYPLGRVLSENLSSAELLTHYRRGDGTMTWIWFSAAPVRDLEGKVIGGVVASVNVDREKRLTESLEREVEKVVAEREAAQEALRQSQKLEAMGQLTGGVAHDFNNLLTPIIGSLDLLQRKPIGDARMQRLIDGALQSAERAKTLVQRLLAFARRQPLQPTAVDVGRIVTDMADLVARTSGPRVRVDVDVPPELPPARADSNQLEMALLNLSVNARDAMPDGGTLSISLRQVDEPPADLPELGRRPHVVLSVADNGRGMDEETLARCIEPFFSTKGVGKGTGLGLSMVHGLAAQLGGALRITSREGVGTAIELWLPVSSDEVSTGDEDRPAARDAGRGLVLLVDDEDLVRESTASMLADLGYEVVEAGSAEQALRMVKDGLRPDLLVSDHLMPGLSGTDLAVRLRGRMPGLPVLIVSGYADVDGLAPAFPRLAKPFRQADLAASVGALRGERAVSPSAGSTE